MHLHGVPREQNSLLLRDELRARTAWRLVPSAGPDALSKRAKILEDFDDEKHAVYFPAVGSQRTPAMTTSRKATLICKAMARTLVNTSDPDTATKTSSARGRVFESFRDAKCIRSDFDVRKVPQLISQALHAFVAQAVQERFSGRSAKARHNRTALLTTLQQQGRKLLALKMKFWNSKSMSVESEKHADQGHQNMAAHGIVCSLRTRAKLASNSRQAHRNLQ